MTAHLEIVTEGSPDRVLAARIEEMPDAALAEAKAEYARTKACLCRTLRRFVVDEHAHIYDTRSCAVCGRGLGTV